MLQTIMYYVNMVGITTIITLLMVCGVVYYLLKVKKIAAKVENIDYTNFKRKDSIHWVPFEDIVSGDGTLDSEAMIVMKGNIFVGGLTVRGFEYNSAGRDERINAQVNSQLFFNVLEQPVSFRQSSRSVDLSPNINEYTEIALELNKELLALEEDYEDVLRSAEDYIDEPEEYERYETILKQLQKERVAKTHQYQEVQAEIEYMTALSTSVGDSEQMSGQETRQIMFTYEYNENEYSEELSEEEIYLKALEELQAKSVTFSEALSRCHYRAKRMNAKELLRAIIEQTHPLTCEDIDIDELFDSSYTSMIISSNSLVEEYIAKIGQEEFERQYAEYVERLEQMVNEEEMMASREARVLMEEAERQALIELGMIFEEE